MLVAYGQNYVNRLESDGDVLQALQSLRRERVRAGAAPEPSTAAAK